jgi:tetratricopeptide (TPR) repeat protein
VTNIINKSISEVLPDFFSEKQVDEFISIYQSSVSQFKKEDTFQEIKQLEYKVETGLGYRSQMDLLITFSGSQLTREKFLSLLLYLSQVSITNGEFLAAVEINEKIISVAADDKDLIDLTANAHLLVGEIYSRQANWNRSFEFISKALGLFESINDVKGIAKCENLLGTIYGDFGDVQKAIENFESALSKTENDKKLF